MRRAAIIVLILLSCTLLALWSPWLSWNIDLRPLFGVKIPEVNAGIQVFSLAGELELLIDGVSIKTINTDNSPYFYDTITPGDRLITLRRSSDIKDAFWEFNELIRFIEGTSVTVSFNLGPEEVFSEGHIIYAIPKKESSTLNKLTITTNVEDVNIKLDNRVIEKADGFNYSTNINLDGQRSVEISKRGYDPLEFTILPETQENRDKLRNFDLNLEVHLMLQPVPVVEE